MVKDNPDLNIPHTSDMLDTDHLKKLKDMGIEGYEVLAEILRLAYNQAAVGKGRERHSTPQKVFLAFHKQPIVTIGEMVGVGYTTGQAIKKLQEATTHGGDLGKAECLGAIVYAAAAYYIIEANQKAEENEKRKQAQEQEQANKNGDESESGNSSFNRF